MLPQNPPIPDQSHINKIRDALWSRPNAGASVMVGSGFSRNADKLRSDSGELPLWDDITKEIVKNLYPGVDLPPSENALRLAQQYETAFGRSDLHRLLGQLVRDNDFTPGEMHSRLLRLPWRDVFTTNWDTLLERASSGIAEPSYNVVQDMDQLPLLSQPRIIKLHGSFPSQFPLISTEEDYRTYPARYAPFVNTVQQAMMETVFCLIGFRGDDPNFLSWSGWVRDNLGEAAPKIYLAGLLRLSPHQRRMLEDRSVVPIDLWNHPKAQMWPDHLQHEYATRWILHTLENGEPYDQTIWPSPPEEEKREIDDRLRPVAEVPLSAPKTHPHPEIDTRSPTYRNEPPETIRLVLATWAHNRVLYPGWLVFPSGAEHSSLRRETNEWEPEILRALPEFSPSEQLHAVRELAWRREVLLEPITPGLEEAAQKALDAIDCVNRVVQGSTEEINDWTGVREAWRNVALTLVTDARFDCEKGVFEQRLKSLEPFEGDTADVAHRMRQERCLWALYDMDYSTLNELLDGWNVEDTDPVWKLRKAAILTEMRRHEESEPLVQGALNSFRKDLAGERSIASASRMSWALASTFTRDNRRSVNRRWDELASLRCHAGNELDHLRLTMQGTERRKEAPSFNFGVRQGTRVHWSRERYNRLIAAYRTVRLPEVAGLPPITSLRGDRFGSVGITYGVLTLAAEELASLIPELAVRLVLRLCTSDTNDTLRRILSRTYVATLTAESATSLARICIDTAGYAQPRLFMPDELRAGISPIERMRVAIEVLSRLVQRLDPEMAEVAFDIALECYRTPRIVQHHWLAGPVGNLLQRSWTALPRKHRSRRVFDLLASPIVGMDGNGAGSGFQDPIFLLEDKDLPPRVSSDSEDQYREVIDLLIRGLRSRNGHARSLATFRLLYLSESDLLTDDDNQEFAGILWGDSDPILTNPSGPHTPLDWAFILLPELIRGQAEISLRRKWLTEEPDGQEKYEDLSSDVIGQLGHAFSGLRSRGRTLALTPEDCGHIAAHIERFVATFNSGALRINSSVREAMRWMSEAILEISVPPDIAMQLYEDAQVFIATERGQPNDPFGSFADWGYDANLSVGYALVPGLVKALPSKSDDLAMLLSAGLASGDDLRVSNAMSALHSWVSAPEEFELPPPPDGLVREVGVIISSRRGAGLVDALSFAEWVFGDGQQEHRDAIGTLLVHGLSALAEEMQYDRHQEDLDVPTIRLFCVRLASSMAKHGFEDHPAIKNWMEIGKEDPFPEVRSAVATSEELCT